MRFCVFVGRGFEAELVRMRMAFQVCVCLTGTTLLFRLCVLRLDQSNHGIWLVYVSFLFP